MSLLAGRYELGEVLGVGGMARVVAARDRRLDRAVAVKLVPADSVDPVGRERFVRETHSSARFAHPNALAVYDAGEADGFLFLVLELVDGPSLAGRLVDGPLAVDESLRIADGVLAALGAAHAAGIVHRDVKPGNVLLGRDGRVKLADFGIAKRLDDLSADLTGTGQFMGTPKYLAPEQVAGLTATARTDLYATGVVLYEMLAGVAPYDAGSPLATALAHRDAPVPDVRDQRADVPAHVAATIARAMAKDPAERFATADEMRAALSGALPPTAVLPAAAAPTAGAPTAVLPDGERDRSMAATAVMRDAPPGAPRPVGQQRIERPPPRRAWWLFLALLLVVAGVTIALALVADDGPGPDPDVSTPGLGTITDATAASPVVTAAPPAGPVTAEPATSAPPAATAPAPTVPPPTTAAPTASPTTVAPTTAAPTTAAPTTAATTAAPTTLPVTAGPPGTGN